MRMNMETFNDALDFLFPLVLIFGVVGDISLITDMHINYAEERLIYELK